MKKEVLEEKWQAWKAKTFTKENIKRFLLVQLLDLALAFSAVLALMGIIPVALVVYFAIFYLVTMVIKKAMHTAYTIKDMTKTSQSAKRKK